MPLHGTCIPPLGASPPLGMMARRRSPGLAELLLTTASYECEAPEKARARPAHVPIPNSTVVGEKGAPPPLALGGACPPPEWEAPAHGRSHPRRGWGAPAPHRSGENLSHCQHGSESIRSWPLCSQLPAGASPPLNPNARSTGDEVPSERNPGAPTPGPPLTQPPFRLETEPLAKSSKTSLLRRRTLPATSPTRSATAPPRSELRQDVFRSPR